MDRNGERHCSWSNICQHRSTRPVCQRRRSRSRRCCPKYRQSQLLLPDNPPNWLSHWCVLGPRYRANIPIPCELISERQYVSWDVFLRVCKWNSETATRTKLEREFYDRRNWRTKVPFPFTHGLIEGFIWTELRIVSDSSKWRTLNVSGGANNWCRPQNVRLPFWGFWWKDGPALRATALMLFANQFLATGGNISYVTSELYNSSDPATGPRFSSCKVLKAQ